MRHWQAILLGLLASMMLGCVSNRNARPTSWLDRFLQPAGPVGPDTIQMDVALIEKPFGDSYLNRDLWNDADEQIIPLENKAVLEDNGFRIGQIGGITPVGLQLLLASERSCANPRRIRCLQDKANKLVLGPESPTCSFQLGTDGNPTEVNLDKAQCTLEVTASLSADGRTKLRFVPQVFHGDTSLLPRPAGDLSGWILKEERAVERYAQFAWEVTLGNEFLIVGGRYEKPHTLGHECFLRRDEQNPVQRLLVIRTHRAEKPSEEPAAPVATDGKAVRSPAGACQASYTTARGSQR
ncbi:MAG: hypothetical protein JNM56_24940 [Planctomycetia bacterium]|nr:hypothetical protein [Planctomycetia bacterium]